MKKPQTKSPVRTAPWATTAELQATYRAAYDASAEHELTLAQVEVRGGKEARSDVGKYFKPLREQLWTATVARIQDMPVIDGTVISTGGDAE
jgi:hypothetical protein